MRIALFENLKFSFKSVRLLELKEVITDKVFISFGPADEQLQLCLSQRTFYEDKTKTVYLNEPKTRENSARRHEIRPTDAVNLERMLLGCRDENSWWAF